MSIEVMDGGVLTTVQDLGRSGGRISGFPSGGVLDESAAHLANALVGNDCSKALLEMTMLGARLRFTESCYIAICGADMQPQLNDKKIENNKAYRVQSGDILKCGLAAAGLRAYLAVSGGIRAEAFLGSMSTDLKCRLGGYAGRKLKAGDSLKIGRDKGHLYNPNYAQVKYTPPAQQVTVRAIAGPQYERFDSAAQTAFWTTAFTTTKQSDRMGLRLTGEKLTTVDGATDILSDATVKGSVQVSADLQPIVLLADAQTTGGYAKIATVITPDLPLLAQLAPGATVRFRQVTAKEAARAYKKYKKALAKLCF